MRLEKVGKNLLITMISLVILAPVFVNVKAMDKRLPTVMTGQTTVTQKMTDGNKYYYGGLVGNEAVLNYNNQTTVGFESNASTGTGLAKCLSNDLRRIPLCFTLSVKPNSDAVKLMKSRTRINGVDTIEISTLFYASKLIAGDVFSGSTDINGYAFWGNNLVQSANDLSGSDAQLKVGGYAINNKAQSAMIDTAGNDTTTTTQFIDKINQLASNGTELPNEILSELAKDDGAISLYLQAAGNAIGKDVFQGDAGLNPEGKVWVVDGDLTIGSNKNIKYFGLGTIIVKGNLVVGSGAQILPNNGNKDYLGLMAKNQ
ncbi:MAG: hypothetical protein WCO23_01950 [bacterium]